MNDDDAIHEADGSTALHQISDHKHVNNKEDDGCAFMDV